MIVTYAATAQESGIAHYDADWIPCAPDSASYYRVWEKLDDSLYSIEDYYRWGVLEMEGLMLGHHVDAMRVGPFRFYHYSGQLKKAVTYVRNEEEGDVTTWHPDGTVETKGQYGLGRRVGPFSTWYPNGNLRAEGYYRNDELHGAWTFWHLDGSVAGKGVYDRDVESGKWNWFYENGSVEGVGDFDPISAKGERTWYDRTGRVCAREKILDRHIVDGTYIAEDGSEHHDTNRAYRAPLPIGVDDFDEVDDFVSAHAVFPERALSAGILGGTTEAYVIVDSAGGIAEARVWMSTNALFNDAAVKAIRSIEWQPGVRHGVPATRSLRVIVRFKSDDGD